MLSILVFVLFASCFDTVRLIAFSLSQVVALSGCYFSVLVLLVKKSPKVEGDGARLSCSGCWRLGHVSILNVDFQWLVGDPTGNGF